MAAKKKAGSRRYGPAAGKSVERAMHRRKKGTLESGKAGRGGTVTSKKQAIAIGLSEARAKGDKVPAKRASTKTSSTKRAASKKRATTKRATAKRTTAKRTTAKRTTSKRPAARRASSKRSS